MPTKKPARPRAPRQPAPAGLAAAVADAPFLLLELDARGRVVLLAGGLAEVLGLDPGKAAGRPVGELGGSIPAAAASFERALAGESLSTIVPAGGRSLEVSFAPRRDAQGRVVGVRGWGRDISQRRSALESLELFKSMVEGLAEEAFLADPDGRLVYVNAAAARSLGYSVEELLALRVADIDPQFGRRFRAIFEELKTGEPVSVETVHVAKGGRRVPKEIRAAYLCVGGKEYVCSLGRDISPHQRAEAARRESEESYQTLFENMLNGVSYCRMLFDGDRPVDFVYLAVNKSFEALTGLKGVVGRKASDVIPGVRQTDPELFEFYGRVARTGVPGRLETYVKSLRQWRSISVFSPSRDHFVAVCDVITERKVAEEALRRSHSLMKATLESTADGILVVDRDGRVERCNERFLRLWELPEGSAPPKHYSLLRGHLLARIADPEAFLAAERDLESRPEADDSDTLKLKDGRVIERTSRPQRVDGRVAGRVWSFRDVSERAWVDWERARMLESETKARAEAESANKAKDDFLAIVSHELRTPLTAILGWTWLLRSGSLAEKERQEGIEIISRNMQLLRQVVEDLIDISTLARGKFHMSRDTFDLRASLEFVCASLAQAAQFRGIRLALDLPAPVGVAGDPGRIQQVFWNLLDNAMKFSPQGGEVRLSLRQEAGQAVVVVEDRGEGISPEFLPHLFELFRQGEDALVRSHEGLGLGLAIVKRLVELHGGSVAAASPGPGLGAAFTVRLPAAAWPPAGAAPAGPEPGLEGRPLRGLRVLVVEDDADTRQVLVQLLVLYGAEVSSAVDAAEALSRLRQDVPDVLLCDIALPGEDGCALIRKVRASGGRLAAVPAAALTALSREEDRARALAAGFQLFLTKPPELSDILDAVLTLAGRRPTL